MGTPLTYFSVYTGATRSEKAQDLLHLLRPHLPQGYEQVVVAGLLTQLWDRAAGEGEDDGSLGGDVNAKRLARLLGWPGDPDVLVAALVEARLVQEVEGPEGVITYRVHGWVDRQPAVQTRISDRERQRQRRERKEAAHRTDPGCTVDTPPPPPDNGLCHSIEGGRKEGREGSDLRDQISRRTSPPERPAEPEAPALTLALGDPDPGPEVTPERVTALWREICTPVGFESPRPLSDKRRKLLRARLKVLPSLADWRRLFDEVAASPHLRGENDRGWKADLLWLLQSEENVLKTLDGRYRGGRRQGAAAKAEARTQSILQTAQEFLAGGA